MQQARHPHKLFIVGWSLLALVACEGPWNSPYPGSHDGQSIYYVAYRTPPKHLDPAQAYYSHELDLLANVYEPPLDYHYLKRPYELVPLTAKSIPTPVYFDSKNNMLPGDPDGKLVARAEYTIQIKPDIKFQPHPCFAKTKDGSLRYLKLSEGDVEDIESIDGFESTGTRTLKAADYVTQICRLTDPRVNSPIYSTMKQYIAGMGEYRIALEAKIDSLRRERAKKLGLDDVTLLDERQHPIVVDYLSIPFPGAQVIDEHTYRITLKKKYPQLRYWLAMNFFTAIPQEAVDFYGQAPLIARDITLDRFPVGTGPYRIERNIPELEVVMLKNEHYHDDLFPTEGADGDLEAGWLEDAGKRLPFIERIVWKLEKESLPRWNKFTQGYYDHFQEVPESTFDQAVQMVSGTTDVSTKMEERGIQLSKNIEFELWEFAFNMDDPIVGGLDPEKKKLRQAIAIAIDSEEYIRIFLNGRAVPAHGPIPPGIYGAIDPSKSPNPFVYNRHPETGEPIRKSIEEAKRLLEEAGYKNGLGPDGKRLEISFDNAFNRPSQLTQIIWLQKRFDLLGIRLISNTTDHSTYREKLLNGNVQMVMSGWSLDYPDPENFLFLLFGPNSKQRFGGENVSNYANPKVDKLFIKMESMENGPARQAVIDELVGIVQSDAPWAFVYHEEAFELRHSWIRNAKTTMVSRNIYKYRRIDPEARDAMRQQWNKPVLWPVVGLFIVMVLLVLPAVRVVRRKR